MWNQAKYERGYNDADEILATRGMEAALEAYRNIPAPNDVNEYEVGFYTRLGVAKERLAR